MDTLQKLKEGKHIEIPIYDFTTHARAKYKVQMYSIIYLYGTIVSNRDSIGTDKSVLNNKVFLLIQGWCEILDR